MTCTWDSNAGLLNKDGGLESPSLQQARLAVLEAAWPCFQDVSGLGGKLRE